MTSAARALLDGLIDFAGLFPPAALSMRDAVERCAHVRAGHHAWMLGRFIVSAGRVHELDAAVAIERHAGTPVPWPLAVLLNPNERQDLDLVTTAVTAGPSRGLRVEALELKVENAAHVEQMAGLLPRGPEWWFEVAPGPALGSTLLAIGEAGGGAKLRMGGTTMSAFPSTADVARLILACVTAGVRWKATAGLHHALPGRFRVTSADDSARAAMHGFLNVFLAAALVQDLRRHSFPDPEAHAQIVALLEEADGGAFRWSETDVSWRGHSFDVHAIEASRRAGGHAFGSCSFDEPVHDLVTLGLLDPGPPASAEPGADSRR